MRRKSPWKSKKSKLRINQKRKKRKKRRKSKEKRISKTKKENNKKNLKRKIKMLRMIKKILIKGKVQEGKEGTKMAKVLYYFSLC